MRSFQSRRPIPIAVLGLLTIALLLTAAYNLDDLPLIGKGTIYRAELTNAAGLRAGDPVKIAGVVVGHIEGVELAGTNVDVSFDVEDAWVGDRTTASVELNTLLGQRYLQLEPEGSRELDPADAIPVSRTTVPYEIVPTLNKLSQTAGDIDKERLRRALDAVSEAFADTPEDLRSALLGLSRLSVTINDKRGDLRQLLHRANIVTSTLADRDAELGRLITDLNPLMAELARRREAIHSLLVNARELAHQLNGLVADNRGALRPALTHLAEVTAILERNQGNLDRAIRLMGPYIHLFANTVGSGRWFDSYVCALLPPQSGGMNAEGC